MGVLWSLGFTLQLPFNIFVFQKIFLNYVLNSTQILANYIFFYVLQKITAFDWFDPLQFHYVWTIFNSSNESIKLKKLIKIKY